MGVEVRLLKLLQNVANPALNRNVKPPILCAFGDIALAIAGAFEKYLAVTMQMLVQAAGTQIDMNEPELVDYLNKLREGIFEAYTGVVQGLRADSKAAAFMPHVPGVLGLLQQVATSINTDADPGEELVRAAQPAPRELLRRWRHGCGVVAAAAAAASRPTVSRAAVPRCRVGRSRGRSPRGRPGSGWR